MYTAFSLEDRLLFVSDERAHKISVINFAKAKADNYEAGYLIGNIPTGPGPVGLAISPTGQWLYATSEIAPEKMRSHLPKVCAPKTEVQSKHHQGVLMRISVEKAKTDPEHSILESITAGCNPVRVAVSSSGKYVWVTSRGSNALLRFSAFNLEAKPIKYEVGKAPVGIAVHGKGQQVWVANSDRFGQGKGSLVKLGKTSKDAYKILASTSTSNFIRSLSFVPHSGVLIATLFDAKKVKFIETH